MESLRRDNSYHHYIYIASSAGRDARCGDLFPPVSLVGTEENGSNERLGDYHNSTLFFGFDQLFFGRVVSGCIRKNLSESGNSDLYCFCNFSLLFCIFFNLFCL